MRSDFMTQFDVRDADEQAVLVHFDYGQDELEPIHALEDRLRGVLDEAAAGWVDGHEVAMDGADGTLFLYGPDADVLFVTVRPTLAAAECLLDARVVLRYGRPDDPDAKQITTDLGLH